MRAKNEHPNLELYKEDGQICHVKTGQNLWGGSISQLKSYKRHRLWLLTNLPSKILIFQLALHSPPKTTTTGMRDKGSSSQKVSGPGITQTDLYPCVLVKEIKSLCKYEKRKWMHPLSESLAEKKH